jgi:hypothetical protein
VLRTVDFPARNFSIIDSELAERAFAEHRNYMSLGICPVHVYGVFVAPVRPAREPVRYRIAYGIFCGCRERAPMRLVEARISLSVVRAREGDLEAAVDQGQRALHGDRKSLPSLLMVTRDLTKVLNDQYPAETETRDYLDELAMLTATPATH